MTAELPANLGSFSIFPNVSFLNFNFKFDPAILFFLTSINMSSKKYLFSYLSDISI